jgi:hypothetical protein
VVSFLQLVHRAAAAVTAEDLLIAAGNLLPGTAVFAPFYPLLCFLRDIEQFTLDVSLKLFEQARGEHILSIYVTHVLVPPSTGVFR